MIRRIMVYVIASLSVHPELRGQKLGRGLVQVEERQSTRV